MVVGCPVKDRVEATPSVPVAQETAVPVRATVTSPPLPPLAVRLPVLNVIKEPVRGTLVDTPSVPVETETSDPAMEVLRAGAKEPAEYVSALPVSGTVVDGTSVPAESATEIPVSETVTSVVEAAPKPLSTD